MIEAIMTGVNECLTAGVCFPIIVGQLAIYGIFMTMEQFIFSQTSTNYLGINRLETKIKRNILIIKYKGLMRFIYAGLIFEISWFVLKSAIDGGNNTIVNFMNTNDTKINMALLENISLILSTICMAYIFIYLVVFATVLFKSTKAYSSVKDLTDKNTDGNKPIEQEIIERRLAEGRKKLNKCKIEITESEHNPHKITANTWLRNTLDAAEGYIKQEKGKNSRLENELYGYYIDKILHYYLDFVSKNEEKWDCWNVDYDCDILEDIALGNIIFPEYINERIIDWYIEFLKTHFIKADLKSEILININAMEYLDLCQSGGTVENYGIPCKDWMDLAISISEMYDGKLKKRLIDKLTNELIVDDKDKHSMFKKFCDEALDYLVNEDLKKVFNKSLLMDNFVFLYKDALKRGTLYPIITLPFDGMPCVPSPFAIEGTSSFNDSYAYDLAIKYTKETMPFDISAMTDLLSSTNKTFLFICIIAYLSMHDDKEKFWEYEEIRLLKKLAANMDSMTESRDKVLEMAEHGMRSNIYDCISNKMYDALNRLLDKEITVEWLEDLFRMGELKNPKEKLNPLYILIVNSCVYEKTLRNEVVKEFGKADFCEEVQWLLDSKIPAICEEFHTDIM